MNDKIEKALEDKAQQQTKVNTYEEPSWVPVFFQKWYDELTKAAHDKQLIDLAATLSEKVQFLLHAKPYIIQHEDDEEADELVKETKLQRIMFANEEVLFNHGVSFIVLDKVGKKGKEKIELRIANNNFPNVITRIGNTPIAAEVWTAIAFDKVKYYLRTKYTYNSIENFLHMGDGVDAGEAMNGEITSLDVINQTLPKHMHLQAKMPNPWGIIPVVETQFKPSADYSWSGRDPITPKLRLQNKQAILDETVKIMLTEQYVNRTKMILDQDMVDASSPEIMAKLAKENIIGVVKDSGNMDGENKAIEFIQGDPKLDQYWTSITNIISLAVADLKLSELTEDQSKSSATGEIFNKGNDVETANALQTYRQEAITEIMAKAYLMKKGEKSDETDLDLEAWNVQLIPNVIMNEAKMTEIVIKQLQAGLINMVQAKVKLEGISPRDAENALKEEDGIANPMLASVMSFNEDGEEDIDEEENTKPDTGKQVTGKK